MQQEGRDINKEIIDFKKAQEKLNLACAIILTSSDLRLFGCLLYKFEIQVAKYTPDLGPYPTALVRYDPNSKKLKMMYFVDFINEKTTNELVFVVCHEICHVLNAHLTRGLKLIQRIYGLAADHVINTALNNDVLSSKLKGAATPKDALMITSLKGDPNLTAEQVYKYLLDHSESSSEDITIDISLNPPSNMGSSCSSSDSESDSDSESNSESESNSDSSSETITINLTKTKIKLDDGQEFEFYDDFETSNAKSSNEAEAAEQKLQGDARRLLNSSLFKNNIQKGNEQSATLELIKEAIKVEIPWELLLEKVIKKSITEISDNKTWKRINKRMLATTNMAFPFNDLEEKADSMLIVVDTSGSINSDDLKKFTYIVKNAMHHFKKVIKLDHDYKIYRDTIKVFTIDTIDGLNTIDDDGITYQGRGGTSHNEVYNFIEEIYNGDNDEIEEVGLVLLLTDFESDIESVHFKNKWIKEIPYKYIIKNQRKISVDPRIDPSPIYIN